MVSLTRDMFLLTREEEKFAEGYAEGYAIGLAKARAKYAEQMPSLLNRLMAKGFTREEAVAILSENI